MISLTPVSPDTAHPRMKDVDGGPNMGGSTELRPWQRYIAHGATRLERIVAGRSNEEDRTWMASQNRLHKQWLASPAGRKFLETIK